MRNAISHAEPFRLGPASILWTNGSHGHLGLGSPQSTRRLVHKRDWLQLRQVHGSEVLVAGNVSGSGLADADAAVTDMSDITLSIATADCAPVALASEEGVIGAVHGGWKGLAEGVLENTARAMRELGATRIDAALGPCIHSECYEFGELQLQDLADKWGKSIVGSTYSGKPSLNLPIAVMQACVGADVNLVHQVDTCTACDTSYYSYRARQDNARQVMLVWRDA